MKRHRARRRMLRIKLAKHLHTWQGSYLFTIPVLVLIISGFIIAPLVGYDLAYTILMMSVAAMFALFIVTSFLSNALPVYRRNQKQIKENT